MDEKAIKDRIRLVLDRYDQADSRDQIREYVISELYEMIKEQE